MGQSRPLDRVQVPLRPATTMQCASALAALLLAPRSARFAPASSARRRAMSGRRSRSVEGTETGIFGMRPASGCIAIGSSAGGRPISIAMECKLRMLHADVDDLRSSSPAIRRAEMRQGLVSLAPTALCRGSG